MIRCPIYKCDKFSGCCACKILSNFNAYSKLKLIDAENQNITDIYNTLQLCKNSGTEICLITKRELPKELIWKLSYFPQNVLQIHICMLEKFENLEWVIKLVHLTEICGIRCNLVMYPIIPTVITVSDVIKLIDPIRNCEHCKIYLKFIEITLNKFKCNTGNLNVDGYLIPLIYLEKFNDFLWKCSSLFSEDFFYMLKFYTDSTNISVISI